MEVTESLRHFLDDYVITGILSEVENRAAD